MSARNQLKISNFVVMCGMLFYGRDQRFNEISRKMSQLGVFSHVEKVSTLSHHHTHT
jgi:hypothetical protein